MKTISTLFFWLATGCALDASAHDAAAVSPAVRANGAFFALSVADIKASGRWYVEKLGLMVTMQPPRSGPAEVMVLEGGGLIVELIQHDSGLPLSKLTPRVDDSVKIHSFFKAGVIVEDFDATLATLKARGVTIAYGPFAAKEGRRANVIISDNAGNLIQFFGQL